MPDSTPQPLDSFEVDKAPQDVLPETFGFRSGARGTHSSRTMMLADLQSLLAALPKSASKEDYRRRIIEDNVLAKKTVSTRRASAQRLSELYALDPKVGLFRLLRFFWDLDRGGRPLLAMLCATARDPLLRASAPAVLAVPVVEPVTKGLLEKTLAAAVPGRFCLPMIQKIARYIASSLTQSGHLQGRLVPKQA